jgi:hypothetical protein
MSSTVYWFEPGGKVLHTSAKCPDLLRAFTALERATGNRPQMRSCDMEAPVTGNDDPYPPDELLSCQVCPPREEPSLPQ